MRNAINENPRARFALVAVLVLLGVFALFKVTKGSGSETPSSTSTTASTDPAATDPAATDPAASGVTASTDPAAASTGGASAATPAAAVPTSLIPGPGLPKSLLAAYHHGKAVVLLVRRAGGIDDNFVHDSVKLLSSSSVGPKVKVFVTKAKGISRYAWLTQGVDVNDLPALVVLLPRGVTKGAPTASDSSGFRGPPSVLQAVKDALYRGPDDRPYHP
jgi:hypothetical protein